MEQQKAPAIPFAYIFDRRILISLTLLGLIGFMSCDALNRSLDRAFAAPGDPAPNTSAWTDGSTHEVDITLITKDADRLACASEQVLEQTHCDYKTPKQRWMRAPGEPVDDNKLKTIQPYRTAVGNHLVMIAGLWATPEVALRRHQEPASGIEEKRLKRFVARCKLRFVGTLEDVEVRWQPSQKWYKEKSGRVAIAETCTIPR